MDTNTALMSEFLNRQGSGDALELLNDFLGVLEFGPAIGGPWLCGGAVRNLIDGDAFKSDLDFFFHSQSQFDTFNLKVRDRLKIKSKTETNTVISYIVEWESPDGKLLAVKLQAIRISWYTNIAAVLDTFDFTICQFGYDGQSLHTSKYALWDFARKRLVLHRLTYGVSTLRRVIKYTQQGYYACSGCLAAILNETIKRPDTVSQEIEYVD